MGKKQFSKWGFYMPCVAEQEPEERKCTEKVVSS